jgi:predicted enzyme related to lactoylglutathione lyase
MKEQWSVAPFFHVADLVASANYYRDKLGFRYDRLWNDPPSFAMVKRGGIIIMLSLNEEPGASRPNRTVDPEGGAWDAYIWVEDADALHAEFQAQGVTVVRPPRDQEYGCRDFEIDDMNGYRLCFGATL